MFVFEILQKLLSVGTLVGLLVGVIGGMVVGALPGLGATMAIALLVPVTYGMDPVAGLVMLTALYTSAVYGGSITAILLHTPGTPASAATAIDGYELTKQGKGLQALGISTIASAIGGTFSAIALLFLAPPLAQISLKFSSPEYFLIAIFGLTIIGSLAGDNLLKGMASGLLGLLIALIGTDIMYGIPRFTYGFVDLESGVPLIPAMVGMFSLSQILTQSEELFNNKQKIIKDIKSLKGRFFPEWAEFKSILPTIIRSSIIGVFVGILPGAGGDIGSWVSYNEAKRFSKHPEKFGKGSLEGVAASEAANNAVTGGAIIPLLTLGIPGSSAAAVLLGGLVIQGLIPGHRLFTDHSVVIYSIMIGFLVANLLMGVLGYLAAKHVVKVTNISSGILIPIIVVLSVIGSYAINNSVFDIYIMILFGLLGYIMKKTGFHPAPVVLSMILGPTAEAGLMQSLVMSRGNLFTYLIGRPICVVLMILIVLSIFTPFIMRSMKKNIEKKYQDSEADEISNND